MHGVSLEVRCDEVVVGKWVCAYESDRRFEVVRLTAETCRPGLDYRLERVEIDEDVDCRAAPSRRHERPRSRRSLDGVACEGRGRLEGNVGPRVRHSFELVGEPNRTDHGRGPPAHAAILAARSTLEEAVKGTEGRPGGHASVAHRRKADRMTDPESQSTEQNSPPKKHDPSASGQGSQAMAVPSTDDLAAQAAALQAENAALRAQLEKKKSERSSVRSVVSWILVVLAVVGVVAGSLAFWLQSTITDEEQFVTTFAVLPEQPEVVVALSERIGDELVAAVDVEGYVAETLPSEMAFLAAPLTGGVRELTVQAATEVVSSDIFAGVWQATLRVTHEAVSLVLSGDGSLTLDLDGAADAVIEQVSALGVTAFDDADTDLPEVVLFESDQLAAASQALRTIETLGWFLPVLALLLIAGAIWVSPNRRRTTSAIAFGSAGVLLVVLAGLRIAKGNVTGAIEDEVRQSAIDVTWDITLRFFEQGAWALIIIGLVVGFGAWVFGPSARAQSVRTWWNGLFDRWRKPDSAEPQSAVARFVSDWKRPLQWGTAIVAVLFVLLGPPPTTVSVIITVLVALVVVGILEVVGGPSDATEEADPGIVPETVVVTAASGEAAGTAEVVVADVDVVPSPEGGEAPAAGQQ